MGRTTRTSVKNVEIADTVQAENSKPSNKLRKVGRKKQRDIGSPEITAAMNALNNSVTNIEKDKGFALATIRAHISKTLGFKVGKTLQLKIKEAIEEEFRGGRIIMTNYNGNINFTKRFGFVSGKKKETPRVNH